MKLLCVIYVVVLDAKGRQVEVHSCYIRGNRADVQHNVLGKMLVDNQVRLVAYSQIYISRVLRVCARSRILIAMLAYVFLVMEGALKILRENEMDLMGLLALVTEYQSLISMISTCHCQVFLIPKQVILYPWQMGVVDVAIHGWISVGVAEKGMEEAYVYW